MSEETTPVLENANTPTEVAPVSTPEVEKKRRPWVKGVTALARGMLAEGKADVEITAAVKAKYIDGGYDEKDATWAASSVLYDVKHRILKPKNVVPAVNADSTQPDDTQPGPTV